MAGFDDYLNGITKFNLSNVHAFQNVFQFRTTSDESDWTKDFHGTLHADNEDWMTIGTYLHLED